jgi:hypothetical protein
MVTLARKAQFSNAESAMLTTPLGMVTLASQARAFDECPIPDAGDAVN